MELIRNGLRFLKEHPSWVLAYVGVHMVAVFAFHGINMQLPTEGPLPAWVPLVKLLMDLVFVSIITVTQCIIFMRFGRVIDNPLWKCEDDKEALARFFVLWLMLNLFLNLINQFEEKAILNESADLSAFLNVIFIGGVIFLIPVGTSIMHWGRLEWSEVGVALRAITRHFEKTLPVLMLGFLSFLLAPILFLILSPIHGQLNLKLLVPTLAIIIPAAIELLAFTVMWQVCMIHRDTPPEENNDFDF